MEFPRVVHPTREAPARDVDYQDYHRTQAGVHNAMAELFAALDLRARSDEAARTHILSLRRISHYLTGHVRSPQPVELNQRSNQAPELNVEYQENPEDSMDPPETVTHTHQATSEETRKSVYCPSSSCTHVFQEWMPVQETEVSKRKKSVGIVSAFKGIFNFGKKRRDSQPRNRLTKRRSLVPKATVSPVVSIIEVVHPEEPTENVNRSAIPTRAPSPVPAPEIISNPILDPTPPPETENVHTYPTVSYLSTPPSLARNSTVVDLGHGPNPANNTVLDPIQQLILSLFPIPLSGEQEYLSGPRSPYGSEIFPTYFEEGVIYESPHGIRGDEGLTRADIALLMRTSLETMIYTGERFQQFHGQSPMAPARAAIRDLYDAIDRSRLRISPPSPSSGNATRDTAFSQIQEFMPSERFTRSPRGHQAAWRAASNQAVRSLLLTAMPDSPGRPQDLFDEAMVDPFARQASTPLAEMYPLERERMPPPEQIFPGPDIYSPKIRERKPIPAEWKLIQPSSRFSDDSEDREPGPSTRRPRPRRQKRLGTDLLPGFPVWDPAREHRLFNDITEFPFAPVEEMPIAGPSVPPRLRRVDRMTFTIEHESIPDSPHQRDPIM